MNTHKTTLLSVTELQHKLTDLVSPIQKSLTLKLDQALGLILTEDLTSPIGLPTHPVSMMDGYAINTTKGIADSFHVGERITAGMVPSMPIYSNKCARIFTGAMIPEGADSVIPQEQVTREKNTITINPQDVIIGKHIRKANETLLPGSLLIHKGTILTSTHLALCASVGISKVNCYRELSIALFTTGNELIDIECPLELGKIYNSNRVMLLGLLQEQGFNNIFHQHLLDDAEETEKALLRASVNYDVIITTGGVSVGEEDHVVNCIKKIGHLQTWRVSMKPGKPFSFGVINNSTIIGLPGNPVSAFTSFYLFGLRILSLLRGISHQEDKCLYVKMTCDYQTKEREELLLANLLSKPTGLSVAIASAQGAADILSLTNADGFIHLPANQVTRENDTVRFIPFKKIGI